MEGTHLPGGPLNFAVTQAHTCVCHSASIILPLWLLEATQDFYRENGDLTGTTAVRPEEPTAEWSLGLESDLGFQHPAT